MAAPRTPYEILGEDGIRELVNAFYDIMDRLPEAASLRAMHAEDLTPMKEKLAEYCDQGLAVELASAVAAEFKPAVEITVKK